MTPGHGAPLLAGPIHACLSYRDLCLHILACSTLYGTVRNGTDSGVTVFSKHGARLRDRAGNPCMHSDGCGRASCGLVRVILKGFSHCAVRLVVRVGEASQYGGIPAIQTDTTFLKFTLISS